MFKKPTTAAGMRRIFCSLLPVLFLAGQVPLSQAVAMETPQLEDLLAAQRAQEEALRQPCRGDTVPKKTAVRISGKILRQDCNKHGDWGYWPEENLPRRNVALLPHGGTVIINQYRSPGGYRYRFDNRSTNAQQNHPIPLATEEEFRAFLENFPPQVNYVSVCQVPEDAHDCSILFFPWLHCKEGTFWDWGHRRCEGPQDCHEVEFWSTREKRCMSRFSPDIGGACGFSCLP